MPLGKFFGATLSVLSCLPLFSGDRLGRIFFWRQRRVVSMLYPPSSPSETRNAPENVRDLITCTTPNTYRQNAASKRPFWAAVHLQCWPNRGRVQHMSRPLAYRNRDENGKNASAKNCSLPWGAKSAHCMRDSVKGKRAPRVTNGSHNGPHFFDHFSSR